MFQSLLRLTRLINQVPTQNVIGELLSMESFQQQRGVAIVNSANSAKFGQTLTNCLNRSSCGLMKRGILRGSKCSQSIGTVIEARLDKGKGVAVNPPCSTRYLACSRPNQAGNTFGRVRAMTTMTLVVVQTAAPSPSFTTGLNEAPKWRVTTLAVYEDEKAARAAGEERTTCPYETTSTNTSC